MQPAFGRPSTVCA
uniref:Uncharacterized protein n=1 Tax=Anopheles albimanus TaxID=7167 RepID=A0A182FYB7_ANOAL